MTRLLAISKKVALELFRDQRTLALMLLAPLVVITLMYFIFDVNNDMDVRIGMPDTIDEQFIESMPDEVEVVTYALKPTLSTLLDNDDLDAFIDVNDNEFVVPYHNEDPSQTTAAKQMIQATVQNVTRDSANEMFESMPGDATMPNMDITENYLYGDEDSTFFDKMFPILMGFFVFFFVFLISGMALLKERTMGTMERMLATSVKRSEVVLGYMGGYGGYAIIQTVIIVLYSIYLLNMTIEGSMVWVFVISILLAMGALVIGMFISTFANTEFQMVQFIPLIIVPQIFFSGIIPLDNISDWIAVIGYVFPLSYAGEALTEVMIKGHGFAHIWQELLVLVGFIVLLTLLDIFGLRKYRKV